MEQIEASIQNFEKLMKENIELKNENERLKSELEIFKPKPHFIDSSCCHMRGCNKCDKYRKENNSLKLEIDKILHKSE